ncbi:MAG: aspartate--ammonia ligase, partial [Clostridia bacterium]|nr:aspartate--ammonia ligase [Clostridia bacterium]
IVKKYRTVFIKQIGAPLSDGKPHDGRAPDYDDWSLNGDLFFWDEVLQKPIEISSMGIRVDAKALAAQLKAANKEERMQYPYHQAIANGTLPLSIGGGIGQSRLCLLILEKAHVGEVQVSVWDEATKEACAKAGVSLL